MKVSNSKIDAINKDRYIGKGAAGIVYKIFFNGTPAVIKFPVNPEKRCSIKQEISIYSNLCKVFDECLCKKNIVQMLGYNNEKCALILEYFDADLTHYVGYPFSDVTYLTHRLLPRTNINQRPNFDKLSVMFGTQSIDSTIFKMYNDIYTGILCLHTNRISHRDLELKNVLVRGGGKIGITDFGMSKIIENAVYNILTEEFGRDLHKIGPMMGNFIDYTNPLPYQYQLDEPNHIVNNSKILDGIQNDVLQDAFFLFVYFQDIVVFVSLMYYCNENMDRNGGDVLLREARKEYKYQFNELFPGVHMDYLPKKSLEFVLDSMFDRLKNGNLFDLIVYFRSVFSNILIDNELFPLQNETVHTYLTTHFGKNYTPNVGVGDIKVGFLMKRFDLFLDTFSVK